MEVDRNEQFRIVAEGMIKSGMDRWQACAIACALVFAVDNPDFKDQYGEFNVEKLNEALDNICKQPA